MTSKNKCVFIGLIGISTLVSMLFFTANVSAGSTLTVEAQGEGYVDSYPSGILCGYACIETYNTGTAITLTAHSNEGGTFSQWTGCDEPSGTTCIMNLDSDKKVTATFSGEVNSEYNLRVYRTGGLGIIQSDPFSIYCGSICPYDEAKFEAGSTVTLTASANSGYVFKSWSGDCSGVSPTCIITMDDSKTVTAEFKTESSSDKTDGNVDSETDETTTQLLTIQKTGEGTIKSSDKKIKCGTTCSSVYNNGDSVTLTAATIVAGSTFLGWSGGCSGAKNTCTVTMNAAKTVRASFGSPMFPLTLTVKGISGGLGNVIDSKSKYINCNTGNIGTCFANIPFGASVTLTPTPGAYSYFSGFNSPCSGNSCTLLMNSPKTMSSSFTTISYAVTVVKSGTGSGSVISSENKVSCGGSCSSMYNHGSSITLKASPNTGSKFMGWSGDSCTGTNDCTVNVNAAKTITAEFSKIYKVSIEKKGQETGVVTSTDGAINCGTVCTASFLEGTEITLEAKRVGIFISEGFEGPCSNQDKDKKCVLTMNSDKKIIAKFIPLTQEVTMVKTGRGKIESIGAEKKIDCGEKCSAKFNEQSTVIFKAIPDKGYRFSRWNGGCSGQQSTCNYVVNVAVDGKNKQIDALFEETPILTVVNKYGGIITSSISEFELAKAGEAATDIAKTKIICGEKSSKKNNQNDCSVEYKASGFFVELSLNPKSDGLRWSGCSNILVIDTCHVYVDKSKTIEVTMGPDKERELIHTALWELFGGENPSLDSYLKNENNPPFTRTFNELRAEKIGHTDVEIKDWIVNNIQWFRQEGGINKITDDWQKGTAKQVLLEIFAGEVAKYPTLTAFLTDENNKPFQSALADLKQEREGGGREGLKNWISQPSNRQWYYDATGIGGHIAVIEKTNLEVEIALKKPVITSISPDNGRIGGKPAIAGSFYDIHLVTLNDNSVPFIPSQNKIIMGDIRWGIDSYGVEINVPGIVEVHTKWGSATAKLISPSGPIYFNAVGEEEGCFPGVGSGCDGGGPVLRAILRKTFGKPIGCDDPSSDGSVLCSIAAGSIEHDNCCVRFPSGKWCGGPGVDGTGKAGETNHDGHCSTEWNHAFWDVFWGRAWKQRYYPDQKFDLTPSGGSRNNAYVIGEAVSSLFYCGPSGHEMREVEHAVFCCSGKIKVEWNGAKKCT